MKKKIIMSLFSLVLINSTELTRIITTLTHGVGGS